MVNAPAIWTGLDSDSFSDALNWTLPLAPSSLTDAEIFLTAPTTINAGTETINSLSTSSDVTLSIAAGAAFTLLGAPDLVIPTGVSNIAGTIALAANAHLNIDGQFNAKGALNTSAGSDVLVDGVFANSGLVRQTGNLTLGDSTHAGSASNAAGATWELIGNAGIGLGAVPPGSAFDNAGNLFHYGTNSNLSVVTQNSGLIEDYSGHLNILSALTNTGTVSVSNGTLSISDAVSGEGAMIMRQSGTLSLATGMDAGQTVEFRAAATGTETLDLGHAGTFEGSITGFAKSDIIDMDHTLATSETFSGGMLTLKEHTTVVAQLHLTGSYTTSSFSLGSDSHGGTLIHYT